MTLADDFIAINQVATLYSYVIDSQAWDRLGEIYMESGTYDSASGAKLVGLDAIRQYFREPPRTPVTHFTTNVRLAIDDDGARATGEAKFLIVRADETIGSRGTYADQWARTPDGWRLAYRTSRVP